MITDLAARAAHINALIGRRYQAGAMGPDRFDCYGLARHLQRAFWGRDLPQFQLPAGTSRFAIASAIALHPERSKWAETGQPADGAIVVMSRQDIGFHMGVYLAIDRGIVVHTIEETGVVAEPPFHLSSPAARWRLKYFLPDI